MTYNRKQVGEMKEGDRETRGQEMFGDRTQQNACTVEVANKEKMGLNNKMNS